MAVKFGQLSKELDDLLRKGELLVAAMAVELPPVSEETRKQIKELEEKGIILPDFRSEYDTWYSEALRVIKQILPDRLEDFVKQYNNNRRRDIDYETYGIYDYLIGLAVTQGISKTIVDTKAALPKLQNQVSILNSAARRFVSSLFDIKEILQADIFDSELAVAQELCNKGFFRASGAVAGVVLESHLFHVCTQHKLKAKKKKPTIGDLSELLRDGIIDTAKWRFIGHLADLRNLCDHNREREPNRDDVKDLIEGVEKIIKTVF